MSSTQTGCDDANGLLPCPFCGGDAAFESAVLNPDEEDTGVVVGCENCGVWLPGRKYWNERAIPASGRRPDAWIVTEPDGSRNVTLSDASSPAYWVHGEIAAGYSVSPLYLGAQPEGPHVTLEQVKATLNDEAQRLFSNHPQGTRDRVQGLVNATIARLLSKCRKPARHATDSEGV